MAQAVHAARGWSATEEIIGDSSDPNKEAVVILAVDNIQEWSAKIKDPHFVFKEPYWDGLATALASTYIGNQVTELPLA